MYTTIFEKVKIVAGRIPGIEKSRLYSDFHRFSVRRNASARWAAVACIANKHADLKPYFGLIISTSSPRNFI